MVGEQYTRRVIFVSSAAFLVLHYNTGVSNKISYVILLFFTIMAA